MKEKRQKQYITYGLFVLIAGIAVLLFSTTTSILYPNCYYSDGNQFSAASMVIGKGWSLGYVPYKDLFGAEGPVFYLLEAIGWFLGERTGIMILQIIFAALVSIYFYKVSQLFLNRMLGVLFTCGSFIMIIAAGGMENCPQLLVLAISLVLLDWYLTKKDRLTGKESILLGVVVMLTMLLKVQSGMWVYAIVLTISIRMFREDRKTALRRALEMLLGAMLVFVPFAVYFYAKGAMGEFLEGTFLFNVKWLASGFGSGNELVRKMIKSVPAAIALCMEIYFTYKKENRDKVWLVAAIFSCILLVCGVGDWNYYIMLIPFLIGAFSARKLQIERKCLYTGILSLCMVGLFLIPLKNTLVYWMEEMVSGQYAERIETAADWDANTVLEEEHVLGVDVAPAYYLITDRMPTFRLFAEQTWITNVDSKYSDELLEYIYQDQLDWLLVDARGILNEWYGNYGFQEFTELFEATAVYSLDIEGAEEHEHM